MTISESFKPKEFADDNSKFEENGRKFSKRVENTVGKRAIACYAQKTYTVDTYKQSLFWKG